MKTRFRSVVGGFAGSAVIGLSVAVAGCGKYSFGSLDGHEAFKEANDAYQAPGWREAADRYEAAVDRRPERSEVLAPTSSSATATTTSTSRPRKGEAENDAYMTEGDRELHEGGREGTKDPLIKQRAMEYLVAAYGPDKLNDPARPSRSSRR